MAARRRLDGDDLARHHAIVGARKAELAPLDETVTVSQLRILDVIRDLSERGYAPSCREIAEAAGFMSTSTVALQLPRLRAAGYLASEPGKARTLTLSGKPWPAPCEHCGGTGRAS